MSSPPSLPDDPRLRALAEQLEETRAGAVLLDADKNLVWASSEFRQLLLEGYDDAEVGYGRHILENYMSDTWCRFITPESQLEMMVQHLPFLMHGFPGGKEGLRDTILRSQREAAAAGREPPRWPEHFEGHSIEEIADLVVEMFEPQQPPMINTGTFDFVQGDLPPMKILEFWVQLHDEDHDYYGSLLLYEPALPARVHSLVARGDEGMYERMLKLVKPGRRQAAILFADLQASGRLSRKLSSAAYFRLIRDLTGAIDELVGDNGGIVGKHAGDGVVAFFLAEDIGSPSRASRAAIDTARQIGDLAKRVAKELADEIGVIDDESCLINVGVHYGGRLYMGQLVTGGRLEVTALGDAVNECARIQECAREGQVLASKSLIEHLDPEDAAVLVIDPDHVLYSTLEDLPHATEKARRDAGSIPVTPL